MDAKLLEQFSSMGTTDRDVLVREFQLYVGGNVDLQSSAFFLEMNSWNLQEAVGAYFEFQAKSEALPSMSLVSDLTVGDGESVGPEQLFTKLWRIANNGSCSWPVGCYLTYVRGDSIGPCLRVNMPALAAGRMVDVQLSMLAPENTGHYCSEWRMCAADGSYFGDTVWVIIQVADDGLLDLTQQMNSLSTTAEETASTYCSVTLVENVAHAPISLAALQPQAFVGHLATSNVNRTEEDMSALTLSGGATDISPRTL